jgi:multimeric flavodoxin WrbA
MKFDARRVTHVLEYAGGAVVEFPLPVHTQGEIMKKVFGFIGSPLKEKSNTYTVTKMVVDKLTEIDPEIAFELFTAGGIKLDFCKGCWNCMTRGSCLTDPKDDMEMLRGKMLAADFIIFGSPLYTTHVSGQTKTFLDRLAAWYHTLRLAGKPGMTVATTAGYPVDEVHEYLGNMMKALGIVPIARLDAYGYFPGMLAEPQKAKEDASRAADQVYPYITGRKKVESGAEMDEMFDAMKTKVVYSRQWLAADYEYWEANDMLGLNSYAELLEKLKLK